MAAKLHQAVKATILHLMPSAFIVYVLGLSNFAQAISLDPNSLFLPAVTTYELGFMLQNMGGGCRGLLQAFQHACWFLPVPATATAEIRVVQLTASDF